MGGSLNEHPLGFDVQSVHKPWRAFAVSESTSQGGQFSLLGQRRFLPFFLAQFLGAANDNLFKFAFTVMVTYQLSVAGCRRRWQAW